MKLRADASRKFHAAPGDQFFFTSRRRNTRFDCDWSSAVCSPDLGAAGTGRARGGRPPAERGRRLRRRKGVLAAPPREEAGDERGGGGRPGHVGRLPTRAAHGDRKSGGEGKSGDLGGRRIIKKKKKRDNVLCWPLRNEIRMSRVKGEYRAGGYMWQMIFTLYRSLESNVNVC